MSWLLPVKEMEPLESQEEAFPFSGKLCSNLDPKALNTGVVSGRTPNETHSIESSQEDHRH